MKITDSIKYVGVNDHQVDLFEGQYKVPNGMSYNSYVILDEKVAVMDTVDANFTDEWLGNLARVLDGRRPDYRTAYGAGSCGQRCQLYESISGDDRRSKCKDVCHDQKLL